jgi:hypothetical protein
MMPTGDVGGAELRLADGLSFLAKFDGDFGNGSQTSGGMGALRYDVVSSSQRSADQVWDEAFNQPCRSRRPLSAVGAPKRTESGLHPFDDVNGPPPSLF